MKNAWSWQSRSLAAHSQNTSQQTQCRARSLRRNHYTEPSLRIPVTAVLRHVLPPDLGRRPHKNATICSHCTQCNRESSKSHSKNMAQRSQKCNPVVGETRHFTSAKSPPQGKPPGKPQMPLARHSLTTTFQHVTPSLSPRDRQAPGCNPTYPTDDISGMSGLSHSPRDRQTPGKFTFIR